MTPIQELKKDGFFRKVAERLGRGVSFLENPIDEIDHHVARTGRMPTLHRMSAGNPFGDPNVAGRIEENYLYSTRRFPLNIANNTIGAGAVVAGDYNFFTFGVGDPGTSAGYFSVPSLTYLQTNMAPSGKVPQGRGFELYELGVGFNSQATAADIAQLIDVSALTFQKQQGALTVYHGPVTLWPSGVGLSGFAATAVGGAPLTIAGASNGLASLTNIRRFNNPRVISANEDFKYIINAAAATPQANTTVALSNFVEMRIMLYGYTLDKIPG